MEDELDVVDVVQDEMEWSNFLKMMSTMQMCKMQVPDAGLEVLSCNDVLYDVVVVGLDPQDDNVEQGNVHIDTRCVEIQLL